MEGAAARRLAFACLAGCFLLVLCRLLDVPTGAILAKIAASTAFVAVAWVSGARDSRYGKAILAGLGLSWCGDLFLLGDSQALFIAGLVSFLLAHVAYVTAFSTLGMNDRWTLGAALLVLVISLLAMVWLTPYLADEMILPVRAYTFVISLMVITAFGAFGRGASRIVPAGAMLFYISDLSVAALRFTDPGWPVYILGLPFYYTGQLLIAASTRFQARKEY